MFYDVKRSETRYLQLVDLSDWPLHLHQLRGVSLCGNRIYAVAPSALFVFKISEQRENALLQLEKKVYRPEWVLGKNQQGDLHAVHASRERQKVYVSFNAQCAIDVFDLKGNYLHRRYLWDIAPDLFPQPSASIRTDFRYGIVRHIFESPVQGLLLTTTLLNGGSDSAVISYERGHTFLSQPAKSIHGGEIKKDRLYLCAIQDGEVLAFPVRNGDPMVDASPSARFIPHLTDHKWHGSAQNTRGLAIIEDKLYCGVCYFRRPKTNQIPPRIVEFDLSSGQQTKEHWLPSFQGFEDPQVYGLLAINDNLDTVLTGIAEPAFYRGPEPFTPDWEMGEPPDDQIADEPSTIDQTAVDPPKEDGPEDIQSEKEAADETKSAAEHHISPPEKAIQPEPAIIGASPPPMEESVSAPLVDDDDSSEYRPVGEATVIFNKVGLCFERSARKFLSFNKALSKKKKFWALQEISFTVHEGETLGVIGRNGSGKSTLSMICGGVLLPDRGNITVHGRVQLLALGVGFKNELSGRENVYISASLLGIGKKEIQSMMDDIEAFAELGEFMDEPVRTYSSGMRSRLGFAVATAVKPDILILDEILATGDKVFKDKAMRRMKEMRDLARSVIVVSHNPGQLRKLSTKVLWLEKGRMVMLGDPKEVLNAYNNFCKNPVKWMENNPDLASTVFGGAHRHG